MTINNEQDDCTNNEQDDCTKCGSKTDVDVRYSFGVYAGRLCLDCCSKFRDNCGIGQPEGDYRELDEPYWEE